jgi:hypothetical protein
MKRLNGYRLFEARYSPREDRQYDLFANPNKVDASRLTDSYTNDVRGVHPKFFTAIRRQQPSSGSHSRHLHIKKKGTRESGPSFFDNKNGRNPRLVQGTVPFVISSISPTCLEFPVTVVRTFIS